MEIHIRVGMWCLIFFLKKKIIKHINRNRISVIKPNEDKTEYDHVSYTERQFVDVIIYDPSCETEENEEGRNMNQNTVMKIKRRGRCWHQPNH